MNRYASSVSTSLVAVIVAVVSFWTVHALVNAVTAFIVALALCLVIGSWPVIKDSIQSRPVSRDGDQSAHLG